MNQILVIADHPDDNVLGCGGTIARHDISWDQVQVLIVAEGSTSRQQERDVEPKFEMNFQPWLKQQNDWINS